MPWVKIDDGFSENPKVERVGYIGLALQVRALCYCNRSLSDGLITGSAALRLAGDMPSPKKAIEAMVSSGLWLREGGDYRIHEYLDFQPSRDKVLTERAAAAERKRKSRGTSHQESHNESQRDTTSDAHSDGLPRHTPPVPDPVLPEQQKPHPPKQDEPQPDPDSPPAVGVRVPLDERIVEAWGRHVGRPLNLGGGGWQAIRDAVNRLSEKHGRDRVVQMFLDEVEPFGANGGSGHDSLVRRVCAALDGEAWAGSKHARGRSGGATLDPETEARLAQYDNVSDKARLIAEIEAKEQEEAGDG